MQSVTEACRTVSSQHACRDRQIQQTAILLAPELPSPAAVVLHGLPSTGKTAILRTLLSQLSLPSTIIPCRECITNRQLLERTTADVLESLITYQQHTSDFASINEDQTLDAARYPRTENVAALAVHLERLLAHRTERFILAFDAVDYLKEPPGTLLPALVRIAESTPNLTIVFTLTTPSPGLFHRPGLPHINFPAYTRDEAISIISATPLSIEPSQNTSSDDTDDDTTWLWKHFTSAVWDSLAHVAARDIPSFRSLCHKLWPSFTVPIREGKHKTREFSKLMITNRALFQKDDALLDDITQTSTSTAAAPKQPQEDDAASLPPFSIYILIAAYLASYNPPRLDTIYFSEWSEKRKKRRRGGAARKPKTSATGITKSGHRPISRQHLPPAPFTLPRLLAILSAIYPNPVNSAKHEGTIPEFYYVDVMGAVATLTSSRLIVRSGGGGDPLDEGARWRCNVGWEAVVGMGRNVGVEVTDYVAD